MIDSNNLHLFNTFNKASCHKVFHRNMMAQKLKDSHIWLDFAG